MLVGDGGSVSTATLLAEVGSGRYLAAMFQEECTCEERSFERCVRCRESGEFGSVVPLLESD